MNNQKTLMNTITNTYKRCVEENIGISLNHIRYLCKSNIIPTCKIGNKYLINWSILMDYLNGNLNQEDKPKENDAPKIRAII